MDLWRCCQGPLPAECHLYRGRRCGVVFSNCNPDFSIASVATRTEWQPVPGFYLAAEVGYLRVLTGFAGTATITSLQGARPAGAYAINDQGIWSFVIQARRNLNYLWYTDI